MTPAGFGKQLALELYCSSGIKDVLQPMAGTSDMHFKIIGNVILYFTKL